MLLDYGVEPGLRGAELLHQPLIASILCPPAVKDGLVDHDKPEEQGKPISTAPVMAGIDELPVACRVERGPLSRFAAVHGLVRAVLGETTVRLDGGGPAVSKSRATSFQLHILCFFTFFLIFIFAKENNNTR